MTIKAGYVENTPTLAQPGSALFRYEAKMAAVEYEKCTTPHTLRDLTVFSTLIFARSESEHPTYSNLD